MLLFIYVKLLYNLIYIDVQMYYDKYDNDRCEMRVVILLFNITQMLKAYNIYYYKH